ncbi:response regulator transcription factor [Arsenophonus nasoniae]|uniref:response regulator transcription factor n=1 Tax=Arsenophonus nasoniae TaxID=638 RepID=UPI00387A51BD
MATANAISFELKNRIPYYKMFPKLSHREIEVLLFSALGFTYSEIAIKLHISARTVGRHLSNATEKYNLNRPSELKSMFFFKLVDALAAAMFGNQD